MAKKLYLLVDPYEHTLSTWDSIKDLRKGMKDVGYDVGYEEASNGLGDFFHDNRLKENIVYKFTVEKLFKVDKNTNKTFDLKLITKRKKL